MGIEDRKQEKEIDGVRYEVAPLPFSIGRKALLRLTKIASPVIASLLSGGGDEALAIGEALKKLPETMTDADLDYFEGIFGSQSRMQINGNMVAVSKTHMEVHFAGNYSAYFLWLAFCIEVNFGGFFGGLLQGKLFGGVGAPAAVAH